MARQGREVPIEAIDWPKLLRRGDLIVWGQASAEPVTLVASLLRARASIEHCRAFIGIGCSEVVDPAGTEPIDFASYCGTGTNRRFGGALDMLPSPYADLSSILGRAMPVLLLSLAPGDDPDHFSFGAGGDYAADLIDSARLVIAEINEAAPRTGNRREVARGRIDLLIRTNAPLPYLAPIAPGKAERAIAGHIAALVEDGSTIQTGLGSIPNAVLGALAGHRDLGVHSGMIGDEIVSLVECGALTNARKTIDRGVTVSGVLGGGETLMRWADRNPALALRPTSYTHDHDILASIDRLVAVNSAIEVDLTGQVNAEVAGGRYLGAVGGAGSFLRGAMASRGGLPIIALPSTAKAGSRIVAQLSGPVSTARSDVGLVVTEHGVADLRGLGLRARREAMIAIAAPEHRAALDAAPLL